MKRIVMFMSIFIGYRFLFSYGAIYSPQADINYYIVLGKGNDCKGYNICSIETVVEDKSAYIRIRIRVKENKVEIGFLKTDIKAQDFLTYFSSGYFFLDSDYYIPLQIMQSTSCKKQLIKAGKYKVYDDGVYYVINL